jgi:hypothetical protein
VHEILMSASRLVALLVGVVLLTGTTDLLAQGGGGRHGTRSRPFICVYDCRDPESADLTSNDLKKFDQLMAVQATAEQSAAFARIRQDVQAAATQLKTFRQLLEKGPTASLQPDYGATLYQVLDKARTGNQNFLASFSAEQKSGLKDLITKVVNADADLGKEITAWNEILQAPQTPANIASVAGSLGNALAGFQSEQIVLAREMSILPSGEQDLTFHLPQVTTSAEIAGQQVPMLAAGEAVRTSITDGRSLFNFRLVVDLSDLQENITYIFRSRLTSIPRCGQRIEVRQAMLLPRPAASLAVLHLRYERWICPAGAEREGGAELLVAADNPIVEIKLSPSADPNGDLHLAPEVGHVDANEVDRDSLLTGPLGATLAEQVGNVVLSAMQKGADLKATLPPAARDALTIQKAQFQAGGADQLRLVLDGQLRFSEEQTKEFAAQLKQQLSAQATSLQ